MSQVNMHGYDANKIEDIIASDERPTPFSRKIFNGLSGAVILLLGGLVILVVVLWKAP
ncbi:hypothetical protein [Devosia sp.]|uniref:hypothetical protein n=1 Tax=Devosia sp. TaxID=1871048 RepID=UPI00326560F0